MVIFRNTQENTILDTLEIEPLLIKVKENGWIDKTEKQVSDLEK